MAPVTCARPFELLLTRLDKRSPTRAGVAKLWEVYLWCE
jgi:hypothetical protein